MPNPTLIVYSAVWKFKEVVSKESKSVETPAEALNVPIPVFTPYTCSTCKGVTGFVVAIPTLERV